MIYDCEGKEYWIINEELDWKGWKNITAAGIKPGTHWLVVCDSDN